MTNPLKGDVTFEAQGKTFTFKLGTNAQIMLEQKSGMSIVAWFSERTSEGLRKEDMRTLFYVGLFRQHQLTEDEVGDLMDEIGDEKVGQIFKQAGDFARSKIKGGNGAAEGRIFPSEASESTDWDYILKRWLMLGYDPESFWDQTPHTLSLAFEARREKYEIDYNGLHNQLAWAVWHIASFSKAKRIPPLHKLQIKQKQKPTRWEDQLEGLKNWVQATGGQIIYKQ